MTYSHPKCYAGYHGGCSTTLSGDHLISKGVLLDFKLTAVVQKLGNGSTRTMGVNSFTVKVLCTEHNSRLSDADTEAKRFVQALEDFAVRSGPSSPDGERRRTVIDSLRNAQREVVLSGDLLETWVIKTILTNARAGLLTSNGGQPSSFPLDLADVTRLLLEPESRPPFVG